MHGRAVHAAGAVIVALLALLVAAVSGAEISLQGAKLSVATIDGSARVSKGFTLSQAPDIESPFEVEPDEVLRLAFALKDAAGEKLAAGKAPHQVVVQMQDRNDPSLASTGIVSVKPSSGKATWSQRIDRLPLDLVRKSSGVIDVSLLLGFFGDVAPIRVPLITVQLPASVLTAAHADANPTLRERNLLSQGFHRHMERRHTFNTPAADQMPPIIVTFVVAAITFVVPILLLGALYSQIAPSLSVKPPSSAIVPFLAVVTALDGLAVLYWNGAGLTLFKMLPWLTLLSVAAIFTGRTALTEMRQIRLGKKAA